MDPDQTPSPHASQETPSPDLHGKAPASPSIPPDGSETPTSALQKRAFLQGLSFNKRTQLALAVFTGGNVLATAIYVGIAWHSMRIQQAEMVRSNDLTQEAIKESATAADAARKEEREQASAQLAQMERSNNLTQEAIQKSAAASAAALATSRQEAEATRKQEHAHAEAAREQSARDAAASLEIARKSLDEARLSFETSQRARLVVETFDCQNCSRMEEARARPGTATARLKNTGVLPATKVRWAAKLIDSGIMTPEAFDIYITDDDFPIARPNSPLGVGTYTSVIGGGLTKTITASTFSFEYPDNISGFRSPYFIGKVLYLDGFDAERTLKFCAFWDTAKWEACFENNSTD